MDVVIPDFKTNFWMEAHKQVSHMVCPRRHWDTRSLLPALEHFVGVVGMGQDGTIGEKVMLL